MAGPVLLAVTEDADTIEQGLRTATDGISRLLPPIIVDGGGNGWLDHLVLRDQATGAEDTVDAGALLVMIGALPPTVGGSRPAMFGTAPGETGGGFGGGGRWPFNCCISGSPRTGDILVAALKKRSVCFEAEAQRR